MKIAIIDGKKIDLEVYKTLREVFLMPHKDALDQAEILKEDIQDASVLFRTITMPSD